MIIGWAAACQCCIATGRRQSTSLMPWHRRPSPVSEPGDRPPTVFQAHSRSFWPYYGAGITLGPARPPPRPRPRQPLCAMIAQTGIATQFRTGIAPQSGFGSRPRRVPARARLGRPPPAARHAHARHLFGPPPPGAPLSAAAQTTPGGCRGPAPTRGVVSQLHSSAPPLGLERVSAASAARRPRSGTRDSLPSHRPLDRPGPRRASAARPDSLRAARVLSL